MNTINWNIKRNTRRVLQKVHILLIILTVAQTSCKKLVDVKAPVNSINEENVFASDASAISVVTSMYKRMTSQAEGFTGLGSISLFAGLSADEFTLYNGVRDPRYIAYYSNALVSNISESYGSEFWSPFYNYVFVCNSIIESVSNSNKLTAAVKQQLLGEAKFMRAFIYFYLVNLYGNVPLVTSTDWAVNSSLSNSSKEKVYEQIITDLKDAEGLLSSNYLDGTLLKNISDRIRPTKWAATALLARAYLYNNNFAEADTKASSLINNSALFSLKTLSNVFLKNSQEAIWQLFPTVPGNNTEDALIFIIPSTGPNDISGLPTGQPVYLSPSLLNAFEIGDLRRINWVDSVTVNGTTYFYPSKYKSATLNAPITEYLMALRLGEQYLIRAEARAHLNNLAGAISDLDKVRERAGLQLIANIKPSINKTELINAIQHERQVEFFSEWGHRWLDIKRTGTIDAIMVYLEMFVLPKEEPGKALNNSIQSHLVIFKRMSI